MKIEIPQYRTLELKYLLIDFNGTIAADGTVSENIKKKLEQISAQLDIYVLTADTHGTAKKMCEDMPVTVYTFPNCGAAEEKQKLVNSLGREFCAAIGNGRNDIAMCQDSCLSIAVIGKEGACSKLIGHTDVCVTSIEDGLDLLILPKRLIATLRG